MSLCRVPKCRDSGRPLFSPRLFNKGKTTFNFHGGKDHGKRNFSFPIKFFYLASVICKILLKIDLTD